MELNELLLSKLRAITEGTVKHKSEMAMKKGFKSSDCDAIMAGLSLYLHSPGIADLRESLRQWMTDHAKTLAVGDFLDFAKTCHKDGVADMQRLEEVVKSCHQLTVPSDDIQFACGVNSVVLAALNAVLSIVPQLNSIYFLMLVPNSKLFHKNWEFRVYQCISMFFVGRGSNKWYRATRIEPDTTEYPPGKQVGVNIVTHLQHIPYSLPTGPTSTTKIH